MIHLFFLLLCLRFLTAALSTAYPQVWPTIVLATGGLSLGYLRPRAALFAFTVGTALLCGLADSNLLGCTWPPSIVFSTIWIGNVARLLIYRATRPVEPHSGAGECTPTTVAICLAELLITSVLWSLAVQILRQTHDTEFWPVFWSRAIFGFGDPYYFVGSAFIWLQGLFYFRLLIRAVSASAETASPITAWIKPMFFSCTCVLLISFLIQSTMNIPTTPRSFAGMVLEVSLPYEDSHAFGSIAAAVFAFAVATWPRIPRTRSLAHAAAAALLLLLVIASWSRAAWMALVVALLLLAWRKLPLLWSAGLTALIATAILTLGLARKDSWTVDNNPFLYRLGNLLRIDQPRLDLYHKAFGMVRERPLLGQGIGASYRASVRFAQPGDPLAKVPDFMHDFLLQITTEQGLFVASVYAGLFGWVLWRGLRIGFISSMPAFPEQPAVFGAAVALATYLITQLTANSLNVYISNQFFCWFLMAAIFFGTEIRRQQLSAASMEQCSQEQR